MVVVDDVAVRQYLDDLGLTTPTDWERDGFDGETRIPRRTAATVANHRIIRILARVLLRIGRFWGFHHPDTHERTSVVTLQMIQLNQLADAVTGVPHIRRIRLHDTVRDAIRSCERARRRWFYIVLSWHWNTQPVENRPPHPGYADTGHVTVLVFDTLRREYDLWDPNGGMWTVYNDVTRRLEPFSPYAAVRDSAARTNPAKRLVPDYTFLAQNAARRDTVQNTVDRICLTVKTEGSPTESLMPPVGMCASSVILMLACCLRFNRGAPTEFDESVNRYMAGLYGFSRREFATQLAHWHRRMYSVRSWMQMEGALGLRRTPTVVAVATAPTADRRRCGIVVDDPSGNGCAACILPPCNTGVLCETHREMWFGWWHLPVMGEGGGGLRCEDRVRWDQTMGPYPVHRGGEGEAIDVELDGHIRSIEEDIRKIEHAEALRRMFDDAESMRGGMYVPAMREGDLPLPDPRTGPMWDTQGDRIRKIDEWMRRRDEAVAANERKRPLLIGAPPPLRRRI